MSRDKHVIFLLIFSNLLGCSVDLPDPPEEKQNFWLTQGWTNDERYWFHHANQGTNTFGLPYEWFKALEQPQFSFSEVGLLSDQKYLSRFGFIPSTLSLREQKLAAKHSDVYQAPVTKYSAKESNIAGLPVGFAVKDEWYDPTTESYWPIPGTGKNAHSVGLNCAACHTGQLEYNNKRFLIDGGPGMISLGKLRDAIQLSLAYTKFIPGRFDRFARRILNDAYNKDNIKALKKQFDSFLEIAKRQADLEDSAKGNIEEGFTRLDALNRIGNEVFAHQMYIDSNIYPTSAPVSYPPIWNASWFDWVQYNSSIQQPMVRNVGEAMGVAGLVNLSTVEKPLFGSKIPVRNINEIELLLAGEEHPLEAHQFGGLQSPRWADLPLPPLDPILVAKGQNLYMGSPDKGQKPLCAGCHLPPIDSELIFDEQYWKQPSEDFPQKYLALKTVAVTRIGTDCKTAFEMVYRTVMTPKYIGNSEDVLPPFSGQQVPKDCSQPTALPAAKEGYAITNFGVALGQVVEKTKLRWYDDQNIGKDERLKLDGSRPNGIRAVINGVPHYKARPLNGIWATAPFLHNGSIPSLYLLLATQEERDAEAKTFYLGSREFDTKYVGYKYRADKSQNLSDAELLTNTQGLFKLDTTIAGNRNTGHIFTDEDVPGRIGPKLSAEDRFAIIEFLKSL